jgi:hypothetical protein
MRLGVSRSFQFFSFVSGFIVLSFLAAKKKTSFVLFRILDAGSCEKVLKFEMVKSLFYMQIRRKLTSHMKKNIFRHLFLSNTHTDDMYVCTY